ncbi:MAG: heme-copper oxidase subunit III [Chloroflexota bacterium]
MNSSNVQKNVQNSRAARLEEEQLARVQDQKNKRFGLQLWRIANGAVFVFFVMANSLMRQTQTVWPPEGISRLDATIPAVISLGLVLSGLTAARVQSAVRREDREGILRNILFTVALGLVFLVGMAYVWQHVKPSGSYTAIFFTMTGFHALHVLIGMLLFGYVYWKAQRGAYTKDDYWSLEATVIFWHFVDLMWVLYFVVLYIF